MSGTALQAPARPQVNLLPPEIVEARALGRVKVWLGIGLIVVLVLLAGGYGYAVLEGRDADDELAQAQAVAADLAQQQSQYAELPRVRADVSSITAVQVGAASDDILWRGYVDAIAATAPAGVSIDTLTVTAAVAGAAAPAVTDPLLSQGVASITFTARSLTTPDTVAWMRALATVPGFATPWFSQATLTSAEGSPAYYTVTASVQVTEAALSGRFAADAGDAATTTEGGQG